MSVFKNHQGKISSLEEKPFVSEREMQTLVENNLEELLELRFVVRQFAPRGDLRIDTLAFDMDQKSFVIIEYKNGANWSVMDQGFSYLSLLLDRKADFVLEINQNHSERFKTQDINWEASRVIFIAPSFTSYQVGALGFRDISFELYKIKQFSNDIVLFEEIQGVGSMAKLAEVQTTSAETRRVQKEVRKYSIEDHFPPGREVSRELFDELTAKLFELDSRFTVKSVQAYIGINIERKKVFEIHVNRADLRFTIIRFEPQDLKDPDKKIRYLENSKRHFNVHMSEMRIKNKVDIDYALMIARQVLTKKYRI